MSGDITPVRRHELRRRRSDGYVDGCAGASFGHRLPDQPDQAVRNAYEIGWHLGRRDTLDIPLPLHLNEIEADEYARGLYCEETGESLTVMGSGMRFGDDTPGRDGTMHDSPRTALAKEMGDVLAAIEYACMSGLVDRDMVATARERKLAKLLSPGSRDNLGRRLAPPPLGYDPPVSNQLVDVRDHSNCVGPANPRDLIGRRIIRYMPEMPTTYADDVFAAWQLDDQDTWIVFTHPSAAAHIDIDASLGDRDMTIIDMEIVAMSVEADRFVLIAIDTRDHSDSVSWSLSPTCILGPDDDVRTGLVIRRRPPEFRDR